MSCITLLTDFGTDDAYVGVVKGVIHSINPAASVIDITHSIAPHDIAHGAFILAASFAYFPPGTVHVAVVDPTVGSSRRAVIIKTRNYYFVAPDNGLITFVLASKTPERIVEATESCYFHKPVSQTFHARDIFAPVAAHITLDADITRFGRTIDAAELVRIPDAKPVVTSEEITGRILYADHFGNLITNIPAQIIQDFAAAHPGTLTAHVAGAAITGLRQTYADVRGGALMLIISSSGYLEISANEASAAKLLGANRGEAVRITAR